MGELNPKQHRFVLEYLKDLNATQAAIRAGYSEQTAHSQGPRLLEHVGVAEAIRAGLERSTAKAHLTIERVDQEIARLAFSDPRKLVNPDGTYKALHELDDDAAAAVAGVEVEQRKEGQGDKASTITTRKIRTWDKPAALTLAARRLKLLTDKIEHGGEVKLRQLLDQSYDKPEDAA